MQPRQPQQKTKAPKRKPSLKNSIDKGDKVKIVNPGRNLSAAWKSAQKMKSKWYKGIVIGNRPDLYENNIFRVIASHKSGQYTNLFLIRNNELELDLIISEDGLKRLPYDDFLTSEDFLL